MTSLLYLPPLLVTLFVPMLALVAIWLGLPAQRTAAVATAFNAVLATGICILISSRPLDASVFDVNFPWAAVPGWPEIDCHLALNGLSALILIVVNWVAFLAVTRMPAKNASPGVFACGLLILNTSAIGVLLFENIFGLIFFLLLMVIPPFLLIGKWGGHNRQLGSFQTTVSWVIAVGLISTGLLGLGAKAVSNSSPALLRDAYSIKSVNLAQSPNSAASQKLLFGFLLLGSIILIGLVPAHGWILSGYGSAPVSASIMASGTVSCMGFYILNQWGIDLMPQGYEAWRITILALGGVSLLYASALTWDFREVRQILAAACVASRGLVFVGLGCSSPTAHTGAALLILGEALSSACVLGLAAELEQFLGDNRVRELSARSFPSQPVLGGWTLAATWGACSLPLSVNFIGVVFILCAVRGEFGPFMLLAVLAALFIAGSGLVQMSRMLFFPELTAKPDLSLDRPAPIASVAGKTDLTLLESVPYAFLLLLNAAAGCFPNLVIWLLYWGHWLAR